MIKGGNKDYPIIYEIKELMMGGYVDFCQGAFSTALFSKVIGMVKLFRSHRVVCHI